MAQHSRDHEAHGGFFRATGVLLRLRPRVFSSPSTAYSRRAAVGPCGVLDARGPNLYLPLFGAPSLALAGAGAAYLESLEAWCVQQQRLAAVAPTAAVPLGEQQERAGGAELPSACSGQHFQRVAAVVVGVATCVEHLAQRLRGSDSGCAVWRPVGFIPPTGWHLQPAVVSSACASCCSCVCFFASRGSGSAVRWGCWLVAAAAVVLRMHGGGGCSCGCAFTCVWGLVCAAEQYVVHALMFPWLAPFAVAAWWLGPRGVAGCSMLACWGGDSQLAR